MVSDKVKKALIISGIGIILLIAITLGFSFLKEVNNAKESKKEVEQILPDTTAFIRNDDYLSLNDQKTSADDNLKNHKYSQAYNTYTNILKSIDQTASNYLQNEIDHLKEQGSSTDTYATIKANADNNLKEEKYLDAFNLYKEAMSQTNNFKIQAKTENPKIEDSIAGDKSQIGQRLGADYNIEDITLLKNNEWAVATVIPISIQTDKARVVLKKNGNNWEIVAGPGTDFEKEDYPDFPQAIFDTLSN